MGKCNQEHILNQNIDTLAARFGVVGLSEIYYFSDQLFANENVERFEVKMAYFIASKMPESKDDVQKQTDLGPETDSFSPDQSKVVKLFS